MPAPPNPFFINTGTALSKPFLCWGLKGHSPISFLISFLINNPLIIVVYGNEDYVGQFMMD